MHTQFKAACQRSELFYTTSIQSVWHAWLGGDSRCLGWIHGVNTVISSQHGLVLTSRRLDDSRQAVWRRVRFFYSCCCWVFFNDRKPSYHIFPVGGFYSDHENWKGVVMTGIRWWLVNRWNINFGWSFAELTCSVLFIFVFKETHAQIRDK